MMASQAGLPQRLDHIATQALDGDFDAAVILARRAPCKDFESWFIRWVPESERSDVDVLDLYADAYHRMLMEREAKAS